MTNVPPKHIWYKSTESRFDSREPKKEAMKDIPTDQSDSVKNYLCYEYVKGSELSC